MSYFPLITLKEEDREIKSIFFQRNKIEVANSLAHNNIQWQDQVPLNAVKEQSLQQATTCPAKTLIIYMKEKMDLVEMDLGEIQCDLREAEQF